ncbi:MAG: hypothetical protein WAP74_02785 [Patescibacteria group bacterium]
MYTVAISLSFLVAIVAAGIVGILVYRTKARLIGAVLGAIATFMVTPWLMSHGFGWMWGAAKSTLAASLGSGFGSVPGIQAEAPKAPAPDHPATERKNGETDGDPEITDRIVVRIFDAARSGQAVGGGVHVRAYHPDAPDKPVLDEELPTHRVGATVEKPLTGLIYEFRVNYGGVPVATERIPYYGGVLVRNLHVRTNAFRAVQEPAKQGGE